MAQNTDATEWVLDEPTTECGSSDSLHDSPTIVERAAAVRLERVSVAPEDRAEWLCDRWSQHAAKLPDEQYGWSLGLGIDAGGQVWAACERSQGAVEDSLRALDIGWFDMRVEAVVEPESAEIVWHNG
ncbi:MAG: hypothetical protein SFU86_21695 [Pirellulaceae bacterium]|nr:hypothetical protein [Pirellulaceae bacterium]